VNDEAIIRLQALGDEKEVWVAITEEMLRQNKLLEARGHQFIGPVPGSIDRRHAGGEFIVGGVTVPAQPGSIGPFQEFQSPDIKRGLGLKDIVSEDEMDVTSFDEAMKSAASGMRDMTLRARENAAELEVMNEALAKTQEEVLMFANIVGDAITGFVLNMIRGTDDIGAAFEKLVKDILASIASQAIGSAVGSFVKGLAGVPVVPSQSGGTFTGLTPGGMVAHALQSGGTLIPAGNVVRAQVGTTMKGIRGRDTQLALVGQGETWISHSFTQNWDAILNRLDKSIESVGRSKSGVAGGDVVVNLALEYKGGDFPSSRDRQKFRQWLRDDVAPELRGVLLAGARA
jgi:hypothetical protein